MQDAISRLEQMAKDALQQYNDEVFGGGEPTYPQWVDDLKVVIAAAKASA